MSPRSAQHEELDSVVDISERRRVRLEGYISSLVIQPRSAAPVVEADLQDGSGIITLTWLGRDRVPGIEPGTRLIVSGYAAMRGAQRVMYNPRYEITRIAGEEDA